MVQYSRKYNIDGLVQYSRKCIFGTALTTFSFFNYSLVNYFRQVKSISCDKFHLSIYIIISLFTFYMKNSNGGHKTCKMTEMHLRLYCTKPAMCILQHLNRSLSFDWRIVSHMIFNKSSIERLRHWSCIFGSMAMQRRYMRVQLWYMRPALLPGSFCKQARSRGERLYTDNQAVCSGICSHDDWDHETFQINVKNHGIIITNFTVDTVIIDMLHL